MHRDLKPENLMVTKDGFVKILDFGLAKLVPSNFEEAQGTALPTVTRGTEPGTVLGTVGYMSPEQASGRPLDFHSDQFSLGAILYEMAAGKRAFQRSTAVQTLSAIIQDEPEPLSSAAPKGPANLVWIIERCLPRTRKSAMARRRTSRETWRLFETTLPGSPRSGSGRRPWVAGCGCRGPFLPPEFWQVCSPPR